MAQSVVQRLLYNECGTFLSTLQLTSGACNTILSGQCVYLIHYQGGSMWIWQTMTQRFSIKRIWNITHITIIRGATGPDSEWLVFLAKMESNGNNW